MTTISYDDAERLALSGDYAGAERICEALLPHFPDHFSTLYLLSSIKFMTGRFEESRGLCIKLIDIDDSNADVFNVLGTISADFDNDQDQAAEWFLSALERNPNHVRALTNLGNAYFKLQRLDEALDCFERAISIDPQSAEALNGIGMMATLKQDFDLAISSYKAALKAAPTQTDFLSNLIATLYTADRKEEALELSLQVALLEHPGKAAIAAYSCASAFCQWDVEKKLFPLVIEQLDATQKMVSMFFLAQLPLLSTYGNGVDNQKLLELHQLAADAIRAFSVRPPFTDHAEAFTKSGRVRIGFISSDFNRHVVGKFVLEVVKRIDRQRFELFLYSALDIDKEDDITELYRKEAEHFLNVYELQDTDLADQIHNDGVHVLIDLNGYTANNRLPVFTYCPAPVQISYLGYPFTSGFKEMDYIISDPWLDGPENARYCIEKPLRLSESFITVGEVPKQDINPIVPRLRNGRFTFGTLNNCYKLNPKTIEIWSRILLRVPESRLYLNNPNYFMEKTRNSIRKEFEKYGISSDRVDIIYERKAADSGETHLDFYNEIDIALDTMPLTGGTTTMEALLMGVPVVTLVGETHAQRLSYSIINNAGINLDDCIAFSEEDYVECAIALAKRPDRLIEIKQKMPSVLRQGVLGDSARFTAQLEHAVIEAWDSKFPESPILKLLDSASQKPVALSSGGHIVLSDTADDLHAFVLHEQGLWFESEAVFLPKIAQHFKCFWDFSEDPGMFAIPFALAQKPLAGKTVAIRPQGLAKNLIAKSIECNRLENVAVVSNVEGQTELPDIVRLSLKGDDQSNEDLGYWLEKLEKCSPLLVVSVTSLQDDHQAWSQLLSYEYAAYRLLPGFDLLVPHQEKDGLAASDINVFFCKTDMAKLLQDKGVLAFSAEEAEQTPLPDSDHWFKAIQDMPYAAKHLATWAEPSSAEKWGDMYRLVMNLYVDAKTTTLGAPQRWARIQMAQTILTLLMQEEATVSRVLTGIRIMLDMGKREQALEWADALINELKGQSGTLLDEPFFMPAASLEDLEMTEDEALWVYSVASITFERNRHFSSWFDSRDSLLKWTQLADFPSFQVESNRIIHLLKNKIGH
ncbi:MAG: tetratricopeptide repeat protein [Methylophilaceae bacterium]